MTNFKRTPYGSLKINFVKLSYLYPVFNFILRIFLFIVIVVALDTGLQFYSTQANKQGIYALFDFNKKILFPKSVGYLLRVSASVSLVGVTVFFSGFTCV
jgi:hypothetical protein